MNDINTAPNAGSTQGNMLGDFFISAVNSTKLKMGPGMQIHLQEGIFAQIGGQLRELSQQINASITEGGAEQTYMKAVGSDGSSNALLINKGQVIQGQMQKGGEERFFISNGIDLDPTKNAPATPEQIMSAKKIEEEVSHKIETFTTTLQDKGSVTILHGQESLSIAYEQEQLEADSAGILAMHGVDQSMIYVNQPMNYTITEKIKGDQRKITAYFKPQKSLPSCLTDQNGVVSIILLQNREEVQIGCPMNREDFNNMRLDVELRSLSEADEEECKEFLLGKLEEIAKLKRAAGKNASTEMEKIDFVRKALF